MPDLVPDKDKAFLYTIEGVLSEEMLSLEDVRVALDGLGPAPEGLHAQARRTWAKRQILGSLQAQVEARKGLDPGTLNGHL